MKYTDTKKGYTLYTDASKYGWASVLTQAHNTEIEGKTVTTDHPIAYVSGLFRGSQLNWAALTKEAYAIYMSVKKLSFYLTDVTVLLKSDHLPLRKFLQKNTLNNKVNNWAMELEAFNIKFQHVSGKANILADTLSCLVDIDPNETEEEHLSHIEEIFPRLEAADLKMKRSKCDFFKKHMHYLGHLISAGGIRPLKDKLDTIRDMPAQCNSKEVKQFLGLVGYYRKFVPHFAVLSRPLTKLTCKYKVFEWTHKCKKAFNTLKESLCD